MSPLNLTPAAAPMPQPPVPPAAPAGAAPASTFAEVMETQAAGVPAPAAAPAPQPSGLVDRMMSGMSIDIPANARPAELLKIQQDVQIRAFALEASSKVVDHATNGAKTVMQTQA